MNEADPHSEIRSTTQPCTLHTRHIPESHINHRHHIWTKADGGPDTEDNIVVVCATGHYNIHDLLAHYKMLGGDVPYTISRRYAVSERKLAELGYKRFIRKAM